MACMTSRLPVTLRSDMALFEAVTAAVVGLKGQGQTQTTNETPSNRGSVQTAGLFQSPGRRDLGSGYKQPQSTTTPHIMYLLGCANAFWQRNLFFIL